MKVEVVVRLKGEVLDSQGKAIHHALKALGYHEVQEVNVGKVIVLEIASDNKEEVQNQVKLMCETLLVNMVIEDYQIKL
ncbi:MAG: phosphoribosylformylglycinamidine synthase subunit PurS [Helicobacter sp.]|nr:phosphoribosylformylglycinamidine synthase subunit PurS [Helicobacter sp.]